MLYKESIDSVFFHLITVYCVFLTYVIDISTILSIIISPQVVNHEDKLNYFYNQVIIVDKKVLYQKNLTFYSVEMGKIVWKDKNVLLLHEIYNLNENT